MKARFAIVSIAVFAVACDLLTGPDGPTNSRWVVDLSAAFEAAERRGGLLAPETAQLNWVQDGHADSLVAKVDEKTRKATFDLVPVEKGRVDFWASARTSRGTVIYHSERVPVDISGDSVVDLPLSPVFPEPAVFAQGREIPPPGGTEEMRQDHVRMGVQNNQVHSAAVSTAAALGHPVSMQWNVTIEGGEVALDPEPVNLTPGDLASLTLVDRSPAERPLNAVAGFEFRFGEAKELVGTLAVDLVEARVRLEKHTNDHDGDSDADALKVPVGGTVRWTYYVINTGTTSLRDITVKDRQVSGPFGPQHEVSPACPTLVSLAVNDTLVCNAESVAQRGEYVNEGIVRAMSHDSVPVADVDTSRYTGTSDRPGGKAGITLRYRINDLEADASPGPQVLVSQPVRRSYAATNVGDSVLFSVEIRDSSYGLICQSAVPLARQDTLQCYGSGPAAPGRRRFVGLAEGRTRGGTVVTGSDLAHYEGVPAPSMRVEKSTNGEDADSETGPEIPVGDAVEWRYVVHNTGVGALFNVVVTDSDSDVDPQCFGSTASLSPGDSIVCTASGTAGFGQYMNLGEALAKDGAGGDVRSSDPSHYFGVQRPGSIEIEKSTNGVDADTGPGPRIQAGTVVSWLYVVVNDGTVPLTNVEVTDSDASLQVECPELPAVLQPGDQFVCEATGLAEPIDYSNLGTVTAETTDGASVTDTDRSHYRGFTPEFR